MTDTSVYCMNVSISALNSSMVAMCYCGTGFARHNGMSPKVDGWGGGDASKNQLQLGGSTPRSNIIISILRQHNTPIPHSLDTDAKPC